VFDGIWVHALSPFLPYLRFTESFGIRYYSLAYLIGVVWGGWLIWRWAKQQRAPIYPSEVQDLAVFIALGMILGGRLGYCIFYSPSLFGFSPGFPWWGVLKVYEGGMASHGGAIGMAIACWWWAHKRRRTIAALADSIAVVIPIGVFLGRIANFINGELWGRPTDGSWGVVFPAAIHEDAEYRLKQGLSSASELAQAFAEIGVPGSGDPQAWDQFVHHQGPWAGEAWQQFFLTWGVPRHPSQLYAAVLEGLVVVSVALLVHRRHRRPGLSAATVLIVYALGRILNECWRQWDQGIEPVFGLTRGQILSLPFLAIGVGLAIWAWRRGPRPGAYLDPARDPGPPPKRP
jgi:phosphatidylglycerol:prolipoprotein diacylglycerol transferase